MFTRTLTQSTNVLLTNKLSIKSVDDLFSLTILKIRKMQISNVVNTISKIQRNVERKCITEFAQNISKKISRLHNSIKVFRTYEIFSKSTIQKKSCAWIWLIVRSIPILFHLSSNTSIRNNTSFLK